MFSKEDVESFEDFMDSIVLSYILADDLKVKRNIAWRYILPDEIDCKYLISYTNGLGWKSHWTKSLFTVWIKNDSIDIEIPVFKDTELSTHKITIPNFEKAKNYIIGYRDRTLNAVTNYEKLISK